MRRWLVLSIFAFPTACDDGGGEQTRDRGLLRDGARQDATLADLQQDAAGPTDAAPIEDAARSPDLADLGSADATSDGGADRGLLPDAGPDPDAGRDAAQDAARDAAPVDPDAVVDAEVDAALEADAACAVEICEGVADEDCDGEIDEGCDCVNGESRPCGPVRGACVQGLRHCVAGAWAEACEGGVPPAEEVCNTVDDDCDGEVDEHDPTPCGDGVGGCRRLGEMVCDEGEWRCEIEAGDPQDEICNGVDDDCDGLYDEELERPAGLTATLTPSVVRAPVRAFPRAEGGWLVASQYRLQWLDAQGAVEREDRWEADFARVAHSAGDQLAEAARNGDSIAQLSALGDPPQMTISIFREGAPRLQTELGEGSGRNSLLVAGHGAWLAVFRGSLLGEPALMLRGLDADGRPHLRVPVRMPATAFDAVASPGGFVLVRSERNLGEPLLTVQHLDPGGVPVGLPRIHAARVYERIAAAWVGVELWVVIAGSRGAELHRLDGAGLSLGPVVRLEDISGRAVDRMELHGLGGRAGLLWEVGFSPSIGVPFEARGTYFRELEAQGTEGVTVFRPGEAPVLTTGPRGFTAFLAEDDGLTFIEGLGSCEGPPGPPLALDPIEIGIAPEEACTGDRFIWTQLGLRAFLDEGCAIYEGRLTFLGDALQGELSLPGLQQVTAVELGATGFTSVDLPDLRATQDVVAVGNSELLRVSAPLLETIESNLRLVDDPQLATLELPRLRTASIEASEIALLRLDLPAFDTGRLDATLPALAELALPAATSLHLSVEGIGLEVLELPMLFHAFFHLDGATALREVRLPLAATGTLDLGPTPALETLEIPVFAGSNLVVASDLLEEVVAPALVDANVSLSGALLTRVDLPLLAESHRFGIFQAPLLRRLSLPRFVSSGQSFSLFDVGLEEGLSLPLYELAEGRLSITGSGLRELSLPALRRAEGDRNEPFRVADNAALERIDAPELTLAYYIEVADEPALEVLNIPALSTCSSFQLSDLPLLSQMELPALARASITVSGTGIEAFTLRGVDLRQVDLVSNPALRTVSAPDFVSASSVSVVNNQSLRSLDFPRLEDVFGTVAVVRNSAWPSCLAPTSFPALPAEDLEQSENREGCECAEGVADCPMVEP